MKEVMVMCGSGVATSTIVKEKLQEWLDQQPYANGVVLKQGKISEVLPKISAYDAVVSAVVVPDEYKEKVINGVPLLTNQDPSSVFNALEKQLDLH